MTDRNELVRLTWRDWWSTRGHNGSMVLPRFRAERLILWAWDTFGPIVFRIDPLPPAMSAGPPKERTLLTKLLSLLAVLSPLVTAAKANPKLFGVAIAAVVIAFLDVAAVYLPTSAARAYPVIVLDLVIAALGVALLIGQPVEATIDPPVPLPAPQPKAPTES
jgi:hypothetical protein